MTFKKRPAVIDIGSNSVRLVIYEDFSPATTIFYNEKFSCKLGRFNNDNSLTETAKQHTKQALIRFKKICDSNNVSVIKAIATAALRDAVDGENFAQELKSLTGIDVTIISGNAEAVYATKGLLYKIPHACGLVGDLGGGSLELSTIHKTKILYNSIMSMPLGVLRLQNDISEIFNIKNYETHIQKILEKHIQFSTKTPLNDGEKNFYCIGGSWRALLTIYMLHTETEIFVLQYFTVNTADILPFLELIIHQQFDTSKIKTDTISKRRMSSLPIAALILKMIIQEYAIENVIISSAGIREGILVEILPFQRETESSSLSYAISEANLRARNPLMLSAFIKNIDQIIPDMSDKQKLLAEIIVYLSDIAYRCHVDFRAEYIFDYTLYSHLDDLTHLERLVVATAIAWRYDPDFKPRKNFSAYLEQNKNLFYFARTMGLALRYLYSATGLCHKAAEKITFIRTSTSLEQKIITDSDDDTVPPQGEMSSKRYTALIKHLGISINE